MRLIRLLLAPALLCFLSVSSFAFDMPALKARVNDYATLLTQEQRSALETILKSLEDQTTAQVVVLTVPHMQGEDITSYSVKVFEAWKLGQKGKDNGLLVLYAVKEDKYRLEVGYGLEGAIPDGKAGDIIRHQLRAHADPKNGPKDFNGAFVAGVSAISNIVLTEYAKDPTGASMRKAPDFDIDTFLGVLFVAVMVAGVAGSFHAMFGGIVGALEGIVVALIYSLAIQWLIVLAMVGFFIGLIAKDILKAVLSGNGGDSSQSGSSSSSRGGFSGGGGRSGGGGASG